MKQQLIPKQKLEQTQKYNQKFQKSLNILSLNNEELKIYLKEQMTSLPFLSFSHSENTSFLIESNAKEETLYDVLMKQIPYFDPPLNQEICDYLISQLDSNGYFKLNKKELLKQANFPAVLIDATLSALQQCEPYGCFAFSLAECLKLQCLQNSHPASETALILCDYLQDIVNGQLSRVSEATGFSLDEIREGFHFIQSLNPKPAAQYAQMAIYAQPELKVSLVDSKIKIECNDADLQLTFDALNNQESKEVQKFMRSQRKAAQELMNALQKRNATLIQIMQVICEIQSDYFLNNGNLKPMTLQQVAQKCDLHVSTISRAIANKSFEFNQRYILLKKMFTHGGTNTSEGKIKERMIDYIEHEGSEPYSDEDLRKLLAKEEIFVSRRTIAKYRESCRILNSTQRKAKQQL